MVCEKCGREKMPNQLCECEMEEIKAKYDKANKGIMSVFTSPYALLLIIIMIINIAIVVLSEAILGAGGVSGSSFVSGIISALPNAILLLGFVKLYLHSKEGKIPMNTSGFTILKGYTSVLFALMGLFFIAMLMSTLGLLGIKNDQQFVDMLKAYLGDVYVELRIESLESVLYEIVMISVIIIDVLIAVYLVFLNKLIKFIDYVKNVANGNGYGKMSMMVIILMFASGAFTFIASLSYLKVKDVYTFISFVFAASISMLMGVILNSIRKVIKNALEME